MKLFLVAALLGLVAAQPGPGGRRGGMIRCINEHISKQDQRVMRAATKDITWECPEEPEGASQTGPGMEEGHPGAKKRPRCKPTPEAHEKILAALVAAFEAKAKKLDATFNACRGSTEGMKRCIFKKISLGDLKAMREATKDITWECPEQPEGGEQTGPGMEKGHPGAGKRPRCEPTPEAKEEILAALVAAYGAKAKELDATFNACRGKSEGGQKRGIGTEEAYPVCVQNWFNYPDYPYSVCVQNWINTIELD